MDHAPLPDLDALDREALLDLIRTHEQQLASLIAAQDEEIRRLEAELFRMRIARGCSSRPKNSTRAESALSTSS